MKKIIEWILSLFNSSKKSNSSNDPEIPDSSTVPPTVNPEVPTKEEIDNFPPKYFHGIDISHHNAKVDFDKIKADFIFMKATEGKSFVSPVYKERMELAQKKGFSCGAYHYYKPGIDPIVQAKHFCNHVTGELPAVLDIEDSYSSRTKIIADLKKFLDYIENKTGKTPIIYTGYSYIKDMNLPEHFSKYPLWLAWYTTADKVKAPAPWNDWTYWQYSENGNVEGVGKCDVNWRKS